MKEVIVGSSGGCDVKVTNEFVSRRHCRLLYSSGGVWIEDLDSSNGTSVDGQRIRPGQRIRVGPSSEVVLAERIPLSWDKIRSYQPGGRSTSRPRTQGTGMLDLNWRSGSGGAVGTAQETLHRLGYNPVSNLPRAYASLNAPQAVRVGALFTLISTALAVLGVYFFIEGSVIGSFSDLGVNDAFASSFSCFILFGSLAATHFLVRKMFGRARHFDLDVFVAGVCSLPFGIAALASGIVGIFNANIIALFAFFAFCYVMMILYSSLTNVSSVPAKIAIPSVPAIAVGSAYLSSTFISVFII